MIRTYSSTIRRKEMDAVLTCMVDEKIGPGDMNRRLVQQIKETLAIDGAAAVRSPSIALQYIIKALNLASGSSIILSALAPSWQLLTVEALGLTPVVVDIEPETAQMSAAAVEEAAAAGAKAVLLTETLGVLPDMERFAALEIPVIEDCSMGYGGCINGQYAGTFGEYAILGLEEHDSITGGGGAVIIAPSRKSWSAIKRFIDAAPAADILPDLNSALAYVQLKEFERNELRRKELFSAYRQALMQSRHTTFSFSDDDTRKTAACVFPVALAGGYKEVKQYAARKDIEIEPAFADSIVALRPSAYESCVQANSLFLRTALFPLYPRLSGVQVEKIIKVLRNLP